MNGEFQRPRQTVHPKGNDNYESDAGILMANLLCFKNCTLVSYIHEYPREADLKWSLFCAACNSYRFDSVLRPFPPLFLIDENYKEIDRLREVIELCPSMPELLKQLQENEVPTTLLDLLYYVLVQLNDPSYKFIPKDEHQNIMSKVPSEIIAAMPDYIFSVTYGSKHQQKFALTALNRSTKFAFHGSHLDNFYSIVYNGLQVSFSKIGGFGPGTYLSSEMGISLAYSPVGFSWKFSCFGNRISIVALCEVIDHPEVRSEFDTKKGSNINLFDIRNSSSSPGKYFIVENNDLVRVCYLLVYSSYDPEAAALMTSPTLLGWIKRHKMFTFALAYIILLLAIGSTNSSLIHKLYRRLFK